MNVVVLARAPRTRLEDLLLRRAREWGDAVAPGRCSVAEAFPREMAGPLIAVGTRVPRLAPVHAAVARLDLEEGGDVSFGPTFGGGLYLVAMREPRPDVLPGDWESPGAFAEAVRRAHAAGLEIGWLRMERALVTESDRVALRADPLVPSDVRGLLDTSRL